MCFKTRSNETNMLPQYHPTLLDATCCPYLNTISWVMLDDGGSTLKGLKFSLTLTLSNVLAINKLWPIPWALTPFRLANKTILSSYSTSTLIGFKMSDIRHVVLHRVFSMFGTDRFQPRFGPSKFPTNCS